jgi:hypothetical protein
MTEQKDIERLREVKGLVAKQLGGAPSNPLLLKALMDCYMQHKD